MREAVRLSWDGRSQRAEMLLDRAEKLNALRLRDLQGLAELSERLVQGPNGPRVLTLMSATERAFSVGADIEEWAGLSPLEAMAASERGTAALAKLASLPYPIVAGISGHCLGGGLELALACDLRVADRTARLGFPEATLGNATGWGGLSRLVAAVGPGRAKDLLLTGRILDAEEALALGLVERLVDEGELRDGVEDLADRLVANAPVALRTIKRAVDVLAAPAPHATYAEALTAAVHAGTEDARRGKQSFKSRSVVEFEGR